MATKATTERLDYDPTIVGSALGAANEASRAVSRGISDVAQATSDAVLLSLSAAAVTLGTIRSFKKKDKGGEVQDPELGVMTYGKQSIETKQESFDRYNPTKMYSLKIGDFFMPLSQSFTLRAKKRLNISSLVDGVDIIQQTRKEAKTIDCVLRLTLRDNQPNLTITDSITGKAEEIFTRSYTNLAGGFESTDEGVVTTSHPKYILTAFTRFLSDIYEQDKVVKIENDVINKTLGVEYAIMSEYKFLPKHGAGTFTFEFTLVEVDFNANVLSIPQQ